MDAPAAEWEIKGWAASGAPPAEVAASRTLLTRDGPRTYWQKRLGDHKATDLSQTPGDAAYDFAAVAIRLGKERDALLYLERALVERSYWIPFLNIDPRFDALRGDPHFQDLVRRITVHG